MKYEKNAKVGNLTVFSPDGAIRAYKIICSLFSQNPSMEASAIASNAAEDMHKLGFSWEQIEQIELSIY